MINNLGSEAVSRYRYRKQYKIRHINKNNPTGEAFCVTIPSYVAVQFSSVNFHIYHNNEMIILKSGTNIYDKKKIEEVQN